MDYRMRLLEGFPKECSLLGTALTCNCGPGDNLGLFGAVAEAQPGDVVVAATDSFEGTCLTGDLLMGMARNCKVAGLVTDGLVRDAMGIRHVGLPVFCRGVTPNSPVRNGPGTVGFPVVVGGVQVESGDIIAADSEGVVDLIRDRFGTASIGPASILGSNGMRVKTKGEQQWGPDQDSTIE